MQKERKSNEMLLLHTIKIFERILDIVQIAVNQGFVKNCGTADATHDVPLSMKNSQEKDRPLYIAFLDLRKRVWRCATQSYLVYSAATPSVRGSRVFEVCKYIKTASWLRHCSSLKHPLATPLCPALYTMPYADDDFKTESKTNPKMKWSSLARQSQTESEFLTAGLKWTGTVTVNGSEPLRTEWFM